MKARYDLRLGLGPVFAYEWIVSSRRWQGYALRSLFAGMLLAALILIWSKSAAYRDRMTFQDLAKLGETFYVAMIGTQLTLVLLAAPAATAGAICLDRASGTMTHMLVTDLSDSEIVLGKLAARLVPVLGLVACAAALDGDLDAPGRRGPRCARGSVHRDRRHRPARMLAGSPLFAPGQQDA